MKYKLLLDFDGTITKQDTCIAILNEFATQSWEHLDELWSTGELSTEQCAIELFRIMEFTKEQLSNYLMSIEVDDYFRELLLLCKQKEIEVIIVSDGYNFNINTVLEGHKEFNIEVFSNTLTVEDDGKYELGFPHMNIECGKCGTCKRNIYNKYKKDCDKIIYVGDGYSDRCVSQVADILFAKGSLASYCKAKDINYTYYNSFKTVIEYIEKL